MSKYFEKYLKYKKKYTELKNDLLIGGTIEKLLLNSSEYIDTLNLNNINIYTIKTTDLKYDLDVMLLKNNMIIYRGFSNRHCGELALYPGAQYNKFNYEPIWFAGPEVVIIYCAMNISTTMLKRYYTNLINDLNQINTNEIQRLYESLLTNNISSILAYSPIENIELIDVNNIKNLKNLIKLFNENFTKDNYIKLIDLLRIPDKIKQLIGEQLKELKQDYKTYSKIENDPSLSNDSKIMYNKIGTIIEWGFRSAFSFGEYYDFKNNSFIKRHAKNGKQAIITKYKRGGIQPSNVSDLSNITVRRDKNIKLLNNIDTDRQILNKINTMNNESATKYDNFLIDMKNKIKVEIDKLNTKAEFKKDFFKKSFEDNNKRAYDIINKIKAGELPGYTVNLNNGSMIGFLKIPSSSLESVQEQYRVYFYYVPSNKKYTNPSSIDTNNTQLNNEMKDCKMCRLARTNDWINEMHHDSLTHKNGLSNNIIYWQYNSTTDSIEKAGITFQQLYGKNMDFKYEERVLAIPYNHVGTMGHHPDCSISSKIFGPYGSYHPKEHKYNCGALLYKNSSDAEIINNLLSTYKSALLYAYARSGQKTHKIAELNYTIENGKFYKYKDPVNSGQPQIYIFFHIKANSEPHLHMHTFIDSNGTNLQNILNNMRIKINGMSMNNNDVINDTDFDPTNFILFNTGDNVLPDNNSGTDNLDDSDDSDDAKAGVYYGGSIGSEIFGSDEYEEFLDCPTKIKTSDGKTKKIQFIKCNGPKKLNENSTGVVWDQPKDWTDMFGIKSSNYDNKNKYHFAGSFEYLFKTMLGFEDNKDPEIRKRMSHAYIFDDPEYDLHQDLFFDQHALFDDSIEQYTQQFLTDRYEQTSKPLYPDYKQYQNNYVPDKVYQDSIIEVKYGDYADEKHITRASTTINDGLAMLLMQIALIDLPNIGGYYGHSAPLLNKWNNITHTEIGLFNSIDYPLKLVKNAKYASCNQDNVSSIKFKNEIFFAVYLYTVYQKESQLAYTKIDENTWIERDIIGDFMKSGKSQVGGKTDIKPDNVNIKPTNINIKQLGTDNSKLYNIFYNEVMKFNKLFPKYIVNYKDKLVVNIFNAMYYKSVPTSGQLLDMMKEKPKKETTC